MCYNPRKIELEFMTSIKIKCFLSVRGEQLIAKHSS